MKKYWWLVFSLIIVIVIALIYILIPANIIVSEYVYVKCKSTATVRYLQDDNRWQHWLGEMNTKKDFMYDNDVYKPGTKKYSSLSLSITNNDNNYPSEINVIPIDADSSAVQWQLQFEASNSPFKRLEQYQTAKKIKKDMAALLDSFKIFITNTKHVYGFEITYTTLTDTTLVSLKTTIKQYPSTELIYSMVDKLREYIAQQHANEHNYPMLNVTKQRDSSYEVKVGIPTNIPLPGNNNIEVKRMVMIKNKTLITEVRGDTSAIRKAFEATSNFMKDYELRQPVIPFQQLVTDRRKEKDSTKWITRIFSPIS